MFHQGFVQWFGHWVRAVKYQYGSRKGSGMGSFTVVWVLKYMWGSSTGILVEFGCWNIKCCLAIGISVK